MRLVLDWMRLVLDWMRLVLDWMRLVLDWMRLASSKAGGLEKLSTSRVLQTRRLQSSSIPQLRSRLISDSLEFRFL
ncbi:MAG: hypothetical protein RBR69_09435 [Candidatus Cloacimonadaceae bacterium]|jgi:hypothetical protein|nr:hypothetical protein [Candidatus Cloacimonadaceae bacterium]